MRRWSTEEDLRLVGAATDEAMQLCFPEVGLSTLQRRRRMLRDQPRITAGVTLGLTGLEGTRYDPRNFTAIIVGDLQSPFYDVRALASFNHMLADIDIDLLIDDGDHYDNYAISRFNKSDGRGTPEAFKEEIELGTAIFETWRVLCGWDTDIILLKGNHEDRWDIYLESGDLDHLYKVAGDRLTFSSIYGLDELNVIVVPYKKPVLIGDVIITHGTTTSSLAGNTVRNMIRSRFGQSVIVGHGHTGAMVIQRYIGRQAVGIENFTLCDLDALGYAEFPNWCQGFTYMRVYDGVTHLLPIVMNNQTFSFEGEIYTPEGKV